MCERLGLEDMRNEQLFLLEVLLDKILIIKEHPIIASRKEGTPLPPLRVRVKFIDFPCIEINQESFGSAGLCPCPDEPPDEGQDAMPSTSATASTSQPDPRRDQNEVEDASLSGKVRGNSAAHALHSYLPDQVPSKRVPTTGPIYGGCAFNSGKSFLFPMVPLELIRCIQRHPLSIYVFRQPEAADEDETPPPPCVIGQILVRLGPDFCDAIARAVNEPIMLPISATLEEIYNLTTVFGDVTGRVSVFTRLSCFGGTIVTQFQLAGKDKAYLFKNSNADSTFRCRGAAPSCLERDDDSPEGRRTQALKKLFKADISPLNPLMTTEQDIVTLKPPGESPDDGPFRRAVAWKKCSGWGENAYEAKPQNTYRQIGPSGQSCPPSEFTQPPSGHVCPLSDMSQPPYRMSTQTPKPTCTRPQTAPHLITECECANIMTALMDSPPGGGKTPTERCRYPCQTCDLIAECVAACHFSDTPEKVVPLGARNITEPKPPTTTQVPINLGRQIPVTLEKPYTNVMDISPRQPPLDCPMVDCPFRPKPGQDTASKLPEDTSAADAAKKPNSPDEGVQNAKLKSSEKMKSALTSTTTPKEPGPKKSELKKAGSLEGNEDKRLDSKVTVSVQPAPPQILKEKPAVPEKSESLPNIPTSKAPEQKKSASIGNLKPVRRKQHNPRSVFEYTEGMYPGVCAGHRHCVKPRRFVPRNQGWLWDAGDTLGLKPRRGWKPGAIGKTIAAMIRQVKRAAGMMVEEPRPATPTGQTKRGKRGGAGKASAAAGSAGPRPGESDTGPHHVQPTLRVIRKDGAYHVAMYPIRGESEDDDEEQQPLQFKIMQDSDDSSGSSAESSLDIEFTCPGALRRKPIRPETALVDTQYRKADFVGGGDSKKSSKTRINPKTGSKSLIDPRTASKSVLWDQDQKTQMSKTPKKK